MTTHIHLELNVTYAANMWFRPLTTELLDDHGNLVDAAHPVAGSSLNYDIERRPDNVWLLHLDVGLCIRPIAEIKVRTTFSVVWAGSMEVVLNMELMNEVFAIAVNKCLLGFNERCTAHGIAYQHEKLELNIPEALKYVRENYVSEHKPLENTWSMNPFAQFTPGNKTRLLCKIPFMIMDEVFFSDKEFDHRHNASNLFKHIPEPFYYTTKLRCSTIDNGDVSLLGIHSVYYLISLDCALQLLVGEHSDRFERLKERGLTGDTIGLFLTLGTEYFDYMRKSFKRSNFRVANFDRRPDWNALVR